MRCFPLFLVSLQLLFAGYDTTAITVSYALYLLAKNPEKRRLLEAEIDRVLPPNPETGDLPLPGYADISRLKFTLGVAKESLRLFPPAPLTTRTSTEPVELDAEPEEGAEEPEQNDDDDDGHKRPRKTLHFPAGTSFWVPIWHIHHQDKYWPEAEDFQPERFLTEEEREQLESAAQRHSPFAGGDLSASLNTRLRKPSSDNNSNNEPISRSGSALPFEPTTSSVKKSGSSSRSSNSSGGLANANSMYKFLPFAQGPRNCVGYRFAQLEATVMIACLCQRLRFELEDPDWNVTAFYYGVLQNPKHHVIPMLVYPRR
jgi:cytochrome P450